MARRRIPVVLVAGFLGSGKTTLLNHLLRHNGGVRIGVVVNDFGAINIDSMMVAGQVDSMVSLGNGCICCAVDVSDMDAMFDTLARPGSDIDVIVVEASGLAEPRNMIRLVLGSANENIVYGGLVTVVDSAEFAATRTVHPEIDGHLRLADLVVLNKCDRVDDAARATTVSAVREIVGDVPLVSIAHGRIDPRLLFDGRTPDSKSVLPLQLSFDELLRGDDHDHDHAHDDGSTHLHSAYSHTEFVEEHPLDPRRLIRFLENPPGNLYRIKGFVHFGVTGHPHKYSVQTVGRHIRFEPHRWTRDEVRRTALVLIGTDVDPDAIEAALRPCVRTDEDPGDRAAMLPVYRYCVESS